MAFDLLPQRLTRFRVVKDQKNREGKFRPVVKVAKFAIKDVVVTALLEKTDAALDLKGDYLARRPSILKNFDLSVDTIVADSLLSKGPSEVLQKDLFNCVYSPNLQAFKGTAAKAGGVSTRREK